MPWNAPENDRFRRWTPTEAMEADIFSFGMLCLWLLFETLFSGNTAVPNGINSATIRVLGSVEETLSEIKEYLQKHAQQLLETEGLLDINHRGVLGEFFSSSLSMTPQKRDGSIPQLLKRLNPKW